MQRFQVGIAQVVNDSDPCLVSGHSKFVVVLLEKGEDYFWGSAVDADIGEGAFDICDHVCDEGVGDLVQMVQLGWWVG
jgi:hypothetical protein